MEELIAEISSAILCAHLQLNLEPQLDDVPHVQKWLKVLRDDKRAVLTATNRAKEAVTYLQQLAGITFPRARSGDHSLMKACPRGIQVTAI